ncbi:MAG TPA: HEAT repeat domain-containing protein, partial [Planctomycetota bacterium]|nr:HEAT repeat domain-containing protein [Planctomycetota bacterium]
MGHRIPAALVLAALLGAGCASSPPPAAPPGPDAVSPRLHHLLDLDDARAPLRELEPFLRDPDPEVRARAALAAARSAPTEAAPVLRAAIQDPEPRVREAAAFAMGITGDADLAGDALLHAKRKDGTDAEREAAAAAAVRLGGERVWKEEAFGALFTSTVPAVRRAAFRALPAAVRGWKEKPATLPAWLRAKVMEGGEPDPAVRVACRIALRTLLTPKPDEPLANPPAWGLEEIASALRSANKTDGDDDARCAGWHLVGLIDARLG